jgi:hypothetical protein
VCQNRNFVQDLARLYRRHRSRMFVGVPTTDVPFIADTILLRALQLRAGIGGHAMETGMQRVEWHPPGEKTGDMSPVLLTREKSY